MRRDLVGWIFAALAFLAVIVAITPAIAAEFTPEELMGERTITPPVCKDGVCTMKQGDLEFLVARGRLMEQIATRLYDRLNSCRGGHST